MTLLKLLAAWEALGEARGAARLLIAGEALDPAHAAEIRALAARAPGVRLELRRIPDAEVPGLMAAADLMVLPFAQSLTSGTVRLAQDYGVPVVAPAVPGTVGAGVILAGDTGTEELGAALLRGLAQASPRGGTEGNDWPEIAALHRAVFAEALRRHAA